MVIKSGHDLAVFATRKRKLLGLTQKDVAGKVGILQKTVSAFENNPDSVKLATAFLILSALDLELSASLQGRGVDRKKDWSEEW